MPLKNEQELVNSKGKLALLREHIERKERSPSDLPGYEWSLESLRSFTEKINSEIVEYEQFQSRCPTNLLTDVPPLSLVFGESLVTSPVVGYPEQIDDKAIAAGNAARERGWLTEDEFLTIAKWKSPRPTSYYRRNTGDVIRLTSARALATSHELECVLVLTGLYGVNVRTASAIVHLSHREPFPLLDAWGLTAFGIERTETERWDELAWLRIWPEYVRACRAIRERTGQDMRSLDRALWTFGEAIGSKRRNPTTGRALAGE